MRKYIILTLVLVLLLSVSSAGPGTVFAKETAKETYDKLKAQVGDDDADAHYKLGLWCRGKKLGDEAIRHFEKAVEIEPGHKGAHAALGHILYKGEWLAADEYVRAKKVEKYEKSRDKLKPEDAKGRYKLALWCESQWLDEFVNVELEKAIEIDPDYAPARNRLNQFLHQGVWTAWSGIMAGYVELEDAKARKGFYSAFKKENASYRLPFAHFEKMYHYSKQPVGTFRGEDKVKLAEPDESFGETTEYILATPADYDPFVPHPLLIGLHGGGAGGTFSGDAIAASYIPYLLKKGWIVVLPTCINQPRQLGWNYPDSEEFMMAVHEEVRSNYFVDADRTVLTGSSMGGGGVWYIGSRHTDVFCALGILCGYNAGGKLGALKKTPVYMLHGDKDDRCDVSNARDAYRQLKNLKAPVIYVELEGVGHDLPDAEARKVTDWLLDKRLSRNR